MPTLPASPAQLPTASSKKQHWHTITLKFIGNDGAPGTGIGWLQSLGDARLGTVLVNSEDPTSGYPPVTGAEGPVSFSVPDGQYSIEVSVLTPHEGTANGTDAALVVLPEVAVNSDQTVVLDARTAKPYQATIDPAVDAPARVDEIDMWRTSVTGGGCGGVGGGGQSLGLVSGAGAGYSASVIGATPTAKVTDGRLGFEAVSLLDTAASATPSPDPRYFLVFPSEGTIPSSLKYTVPAADLTTVHSHVYSNPNAGCADDSPELWPNVYFPWGARQEMRVSSGAGGVDLTHVPPGDHTDYWYAADPKEVAFESATFYEDPGVCSDGGARFGPRRTIHAGEQIDETWNKAPLVPASAALPDFSGELFASPFPTSQQGIDQTVAPATRQDDNGMLYLVAGGDSDPSHYSDDATTRSLTFYRDGELALSAPFNPAAWGAGTTPFRLDLPLLPRPATYKLDWTMLRYSSTDLSATTDTAWTFHSEPVGPGREHAGRRAVRPGHVTALFIPAAAVPALQPGSGLQLAGDRWQAAGNQLHGVRSAGGSGAARGVGDGVGVVRRRQDLDRAGGGHRHGRQRVQRDGRPAAAGSDERIGLPEGARGRSGRELDRSDDHPGLRADRWEGMSMRAMLKTRRRVLVRVLVACLVMAGMSAVVTGASAGPPPGQPSSPGAAAAAPALPQWPARHACTLPAPGRAQCLAIVDTMPVPADARPGARPRTAKPGSVAGPSALHPYTAADLQAAYRLPSNLLGARQTIAIVDAFDDPNAAADLAVYRAANGLPACDADFPCFRKVDQRGGTSYPQSDPGWAVEESLDVDMASAVCPNCTILLVEADDNFLASLAAAVDEAVALGADVVSNSYGGPEYGTELTDLADHYSHPGVTVTASTGDWGFGVNIPAALPGVVAVGGTSLYPAAGERGWAETAWAGAGSGCSAYVPKPSWQADPSCDKRTVADVAAVADPATPVAVYDTFDVPGWVAVGGTSAASPIIAGVYALAGNTKSITAGYLYAHQGALFDVTAGTNGYCADDELCTAAHGYDGPTGLGSPNGIGAF